MINNPIRYLFGKWWVCLKDEQTGEFDARAYATEKEANDVYNDWLSYDAEDVHYERFETAYEQLAESRE